MCRDKPHGDGKFNIYQRFTRQRTRLHRKETIDTDKKAGEEVVVFYRKWGCVSGSFFCIVCGAIGPRSQYSRQCLTPWRCLSRLIYWQFLACKLSTSNTFNPLEISLMKTFNYPWDFFPPPSIFISSAVGIFNNTNRDSPLVASDFRRGHDSFTESSFQLSVFLNLDGA